MAALGKAATAAGAGDLVTVREAASRASKGIQAVGDSLPPEHLGRALCTQLQTLIQMVTTAEQARALAQRDVVALRESAAAVATGQADIREAPAEAARAADERTAAALAKAATTTGRADALGRELLTTREDAEAAPSPIIVQRDILNSLAQAAESTGKPQVSAILGEVASILDVAERSAQRRIVEARAQIEEATAATVDHTEAGGTDQETPEAIALSDEIAQLRKLLSIYERNAAQRHIDTTKALSIAATALTD